MLSARALFGTLNTEYLTVHKTKEDLFWDTYMAVSNDDAGFTRAEEAYKNFISDPKRLAAVRQALASLPDTFSREVGLRRFRSPRNGSGLRSLRVRSRRSQAREHALHLREGSAGLPRRRRRHGILRRHDGEDQARNGAKCEVPR